MNHTLEMMCCSLVVNLLSSIILATGFIHMLPAAMRSLTDACLPADWRVYESYAGLFAMLAILFMQFIELLAHQHHQHHHRRQVPKESTITSQDNAFTSEEVSTENPSSQGHAHGISLLDDNQKHPMSTYLLEFGVATHSVLIGLALGTEEGSTFVALFIGICFHQFFESIALGAQISKLKRKSIIPIIVMVIVFSVTTPIGMAIGIGIRSSNFNPKSLAALISIGVLDSISGGILIYIALVNLMTGEMGPQVHGFLSLSKRIKCLYFIALYLGVALMAIIGRWA
jgi:solute carrier family 39 (zinc transporter), member 1/2/3